MPTENADDLVQFLDVRVLQSTPPALLCKIGGRTVWLPRGHISGKLWCAGDRGKLFVRRWVARDRQLIDLNGVATAAAKAPSLSQPRAQGPLYLVRGDRNSNRGKQLGKQI